MKFVFVALMLIPNLANAFANTETLKTPPYNYNAVKGVSFDGKTQPVADEDFTIDLGTAKLLFRTA